MTSRHQEYQELSREEQVLQRIEKARARKAKLKEERITLSHGSGGKATQTLIEAVFLEAFSNPLLAPLEDGAVLPVHGGRLAFTTDSYVVSPLFFPGGDIGDLAVNGTVNDLAVRGPGRCGCRPGSSSRKGFRWPTWSGSSARWPPPPNGPGSRSSPATPRWCSGARPTAAM